MAPIFNRFPHIHTPEAFPAILDGWRSHSKSEVPDEIVYEGTAKLHGTNVGITFTTKASWVQAKNRVLSGHQDHYGFFRYITNFRREDFFEDPSYLDDLGEYESLTLYGEYVGKSLMKGTAVNLLPERRFVAFAVYRSSEPGILSKPPKMKAPFDNVMPLDATLRLSTDLSNFEQVLEDAKRLTLEVDKECPWAKARGIEGPGEGIVWRPLDGNRNLWWKTKGKKHKVKTALTEEEKAAREEKEKAAWLAYERIDGPTRVDQMYEELKADHPDIRVFGPMHTPFFLKKFGPDVSRECGAILEKVSKETGIDFEVIRKGVNHCAVQEFHKRIEVYEGKK